MENERRKEVLESCLGLFVKKGLYETTTRDLSKALNLQTAGLYYYFSSKDEVVIACAEEAAIRLERGLLSPAIVEIENPDNMMKHIMMIADVMTPLMKFLSTVCSTPKYYIKIRPFLNKLSERYKVYAEKFAKKLNCEVSEIEPYVYIGITAVSNYMIFGEESYVKPQLDMIKTKIRILMN